MRGRYVTRAGYVTVYAPLHPRANPDGNGRVFEHILVVERAMGHHLPPKAEVHHVNGNRADNRNRNLVACHDHAYHRLLEMRERAKAACGDANWRRCHHCKQYDDPARLCPVKRTKARPQVEYVHVECKNKSGREWRWRTGRRTPRSQRRVK